MKQRLKLIDAAIRKRIEMLNKRRLTAPQQLPFPPIDGLETSAVLKMIRRYDFETYYRETSPKPKVIYRVANAVYSNLFRFAFRVAKTMNSSRIRSQR